LGGLGTWGRFCHFGFVDQERGAVAVDVHSELEQAEIVHRHRRFLVGLQVHEPPVRVRAATHVARRQVQAGGGEQALKCSYGRRRTRPGGSTIGISNPLLERGSHSGSGQWFG